MRWLSVGAACACALPMLAIGPAARNAPMQHLLLFVPALLLWVRASVGDVSRGSVHDRRDPVRTAWVIFGLAVLVSWLASPYRWTGTLYSLSFLVAGVVHWLLANGVLSRRTLQYALAPALAAGAGAAAWLVPEDPIRLFGFAVALPLAVGLAACERLPLRLAGAGILFTLIPAARTFDRWDLVAAAAAGIAAFALSRPRGAIIGATLAAIAIAAAVLATHQLADLGWVVHRPWLGLGAGGAIHEAHRLAGLPRTGAKRWLAEFGWIGAGAWLLVLYTLLRRWSFFARHQEDRTRSLVLGGLGAACAAATAAFVVVPVPSALYAWTAAVTGGAVEYLGNRRPFSRSIPLRQTILVAYGGITVLVVFGFAIFVRPAMGEFHRLAGDALLETDPAAAQASYRKAIGWDYRNPAAHAALGRMELDRGALYDARAHLEAAVENDPYRIGALEDLLDCYRRLGGAVPEADRAAIEERVRQLRPSPDANIMPSGSELPAGGAQ